MQAYWQADDAKPTIGSTSYGTFSSISVASSTLEEHQSFPVCIVKRTSEEFEFVAKSRLQPYHARFSFQTEYSWSATYPTWEQIASELTNQSSKLWIKKYLDWKCWIYWRLKNWSYCWYTWKPKFKLGLSTSIEGPASCSSQVVNGRHLKQPKCLCQSHG